MNGRIASSLNVISWNVASWTTTAAHIARQHGSLGAWLDRHNIDILCLQEVKATRQKLLSVIDCALNPSQWDMFVAPCTAKPGLNGVATLVRKDRFHGSSFQGSLPTLGADPAPFNVADLDSQGRCILTDHGAFTLINVYAPYDGERGVQVALKLKFFSALRDLVVKIQQTGRAVICVGDFNVASHIRDLFFEFRLVNVERILSEWEKSLSMCETKIPFPLNNEVLKILLFLKSDWTSILEILNARKIVEVPNGNKGTKFAVKIGPRNVQIGNRQISQGMCEVIANPHAVLTPEGCVYKPTSVLSIGDLFEVLLKVFHKEFSSKAKIAFSDLFGLPRSPPEVFESFNRIISDGFLTDTYLHANPAGRALNSERFTCWDQYRNERYDNAGARIDYIFVDKTIVPAVRLMETPDVFRSKGPTGAEVGERPLAFSSDRSKAFASVTAQGQWKAVPFGGGGISNGDITQSAKNFEFSFTNPPQTGIVYTAPLFSDHVATSVVLDMACLPVQGINERIGDELGTRWKAAMAEATVFQAAVHLQPSKFHSLKDMFERTRKGIEDSPGSTLEDSSAESKRRRF